MAFGATTVEVMNKGLEGVKDITTAAELQELMDDIKTIVETGKKEEVPDVFKNASVLRAIDSKVLELQRDTKINAVLAQSYAQRLRLMADIQRNTESSSSLDRTPRSRGDGKELWVDRQLDKVLPEGWSKNQKRLAGATGVVVAGAVAFMALRWLFKKARTKTVAGLGLAQTLLIGAGIAVAGYFGWKGYKMYLEGKLDGWKDKGKDVVDKGKEAARDPRLKAAAEAAERNFAVRGLFLLHYEQKRDLIHGERDEEQVSALLADDRFVDGMTFADLESGNRPAWITDSHKVNAYNFLKACAQQRKEPVVQILAMRKSPKTVEQLTLREFFQFGRRTTSSFQKLGDAFENGVRSGSLSAMNTGKALSEEFMDQSEDAHEQRELIGLIERMGIVGVDWQNEDVQKHFHAYLRESGKELPSSLSEQRNHEVYGTPEQQEVFRKAIIGMHEFLRKPEVTELLVSFAHDHIRSDVFKKGTATVDVLRRSLSSMHCADVVHLYRELALYNAEDQKIPAINELPAFMAANLQLKALQLVYKEDAQQGKAFATYLTDEMLDDESSINLPPQTKKYFEVFCKSLWLRIKDGYFEGVDTAAVFMEEQFGVPTWATEGTLYTATGYLPAKWLTAPYRMVSRARAHSLVRLAKQFGCNSGNAYALLTSPKWTTRIAPFRRWQLCNQLKQQIMGKAAGASPASLAEKCAKAGLSASRASSFMKSANVPSGEIGKALRKAGYPATGILKVVQGNTNIAPVAPNSAPQKIASGTIRKIASLPPPTTGAEAKLRLKTWHRAAGITDPKMLQRIANMSDPQALKLEGVLRSNPAKATESMQAYHSPGKFPKFAGALMVVGIVLEGASLYTQVERREKVGQLKQVARQYMEETLKPYIDAGMVRVVEKSDGTPVYYFIGKDGEVLEKMEDKGKGLEGCPKIDLSTVDEITDAQIAQIDARIVKSGLSIAANATMIGLWLTRIGRLSNPIGWLLLLGELVAHGVLTHMEFEEFSELLKGLKPQTMAFVPLEVAGLDVVGQLRGENSSMWGAFTESESDWDLHRRVAFSYTSLYAVPELMAWNPEVDWVEKLWKESSGIMERADDGIMFKKNEGSLATGSSVDVVCEDYQQFHEAGKKIAQIIVQEQQLKDYEAMRVQYSKEYADATDERKLELDEWRLRLDKTLLLNGETMGEFFAGESGRKNFGKLTEVYGVRKLTDSIMAQHKEHEHLPPVDSQYAQLIEMKGMQLLQSYDVIYSDELSRHGYPVYVGNGAPEGGVSVMFAFIEGRWRWRDAGGKNAWDVVRGAGYGSEKPYFKKMNDVAKELSALEANLEYHEGEDPREFSSEYSVDRAYMEKNFVLLNPMDMKYSNDLNIVIQQRRYAASSRGKLGKEQRIENDKGELLCVIKAEAHSDDGSMVKWYVSTPEGTPQLDLYFFPGHQDDLHKMMLKKPDEVEHMGVWIKPVAVDTKRDPNEWLIQRKDSRESAADAFGRSVLARYGATEQPGGIYALDGYEFAFHGHSWNVQKADNAHAWPINWGSPYVEGAQSHKVPDGKKFEPKYLSNFLFSNEWQSTSAALQQMTKDLLRVESDGKGATRERPLQLEVGYANAVALPLGDARTYFRVFNPDAYSWDALKPGEEPKDVHTFSDEGVFWLENGTAYERIVFWEKGPFSPDKKQFEVKLIHQ